VPQPGTGNILSDPQFLNTDNLIFSLQNTSECIDSGDPSEFDPDNTIVDIGAVYFHQEGGQYSIGDCNADGSSNVIDIIIIISSCILSEDGQDMCFECGDLNHDNSVDVLDIVQLINMIIF